MKTNIEIPDFKSRTAELIAFGEKVYLSIVNAKGRTEDDPSKVRTGIAIFLGDPNSRNFIKENCYSPSNDAIHFASEKVTRMMTLDHASSADSADPEKMKFPGAVRIMLEDYTIIAASGSGLKGEEDAVHSIIMLAYAMDWKPLDVMNNIIAHDRDLRDENALFYADHYLSNVLKEYS
jgi:hypothetical protein